jgi:phospholipase D1/2
VSELPAIIKPGGNAVAVVTVDAAGVLVDARDYYRAFVAAALEARTSILLSGWQFDRGVPLLRGADAPLGLDVRLLGFFKHLCATKPALQIYILAWDFHVALAFEREWMQRLYFKWLAPDNLHFRFDATETPQASHHQKFAVIDRRVAFVGGIDLCEARWDDRRHLAQNPDRLSRGDPVKAYHDVQAYLAGCGAADALREIFAERWRRARGAPLVLPPCPATSEAGYRPDGALPLPASPVALSRTDPDVEGGPAEEILHLLTDALGSAQRLVYLETQYFSSHVICEALVARLRRGGPLLEIVIVVNPKAEAIKEEVAVGLRQAKNLELLADVVRKTGHALGIYYPGPETTAAAETEATYVHTKLVIVDDRFLTIGSANLTNRSMSVDTELHASWEASGDDDASLSLERGIRRVRVSLLAEHAGVTGPAVRQLVETKDLVRRLDALADAPSSRLRRVPPPEGLQEKIIHAVDPQVLPFDPDTP